jgi:iron complex outermembrane receptor protein/vitamin B12 transporter
LDYLGAFSWLQTANNLPKDDYHVATSAANLGWQLNGSTQIRTTVRYDVDATGVPNAWDFYHVADDATEKDQDLFASASIDNQTTEALHNSVRYGLTRKREQYHQWTQQGSGDFDLYGDSLGNLLTITGANGYSVTGQAILDFADKYPTEYQYVNNRDQLVYQGDFRFTSHLIGLAGFHYEDERGAEPGSSNLPVDRTNYDYLASVHGDFKNRFFYTLGGSLEHYALFGVQTSPRAGLSYYALRPRPGIFSGTRILFNFGDGVREPTMDNQLGSLYEFLVHCTNCNNVTPQQLNVSPLQAPSTRTYEGGVEQAFLGEHLIFRASYFHNQFGREIESVPVPLLIQLFPKLTPSGLGVNYPYNGLTVNTEAFRAQGAEATVESGIGKSIFFRGGYTYLDSVVQHSYSSDNAALTGGFASTYPYGCALGTAGCIPIGAYSPLVGARPFKRAPHSGFFTASYTAKKLTAVFTSAFASRSDYSTFLLDSNFGSSLLLPNRNLDWGYAKLDLGASYKLLPWLKVYGQAENLTNNQHITPIGYPSLPFTVRTGLRIEWTKASTQ